jgi:hypothetical protein
MVESSTLVFANAGIAQLTPFGTVDEKFYDLHFDANVKGLFFTVQKSLSLLNDGASIILTASIADIKGFPGISVYSAAKAAVRSFARAWTNELRERRIRVNAIRDWRNSMPATRTRHRWTLTASGSITPLPRKFIRLSVPGASEGEDCACNYDSQGYGYSPSQALPAYQSASRDRKSTGPTHTNLVEERYAIHRLVGLDLMAKLRRARGGPFVRGARRRAGLFVSLLIGFGGPARAIDLPEPAGLFAKTSPLKMGFYRIT